MTEKLEIAKLATELTLALFQDKNGAARKVTHAAQRTGASPDTPEILLLFDAIYDHLTAKLRPQ